MLWLKAICLRYAAAHRGHEGNPTHRLQRGDNLCAAGVTPHVTQNNGETKTGKRRRSAIDGRTTRHPGYAMSQSRRTMIGCMFGRGKQHGTMRKTKLRGIAHVAGNFMLNLIAYNLVRIPKLAPI